MGGGSSRDRGMRKERNISKRIMSPEQITFRCLHKKRQPTGVCMFVFLLLDPFIQEPSPWRLGRWWESWGVLAALCAEFLQKEKNAR